MGNSLNGFEINIGGGGGDRFNHSDSGNSRFFDPIADASIYREVVCRGGGCFGTGRYVIEDSFGNNRILEDVQITDRRDDQYRFGNRPDYRMGNRPIYENNFPDWSNVYSSSNSLDPQFRIQFGDRNSDLRFRVNLGDSSNSQNDWGYPRQSRFNDYDYLSQIRRQERLAQLERSRYPYGDSYSYRGNSLYGGNQNNLRVGFNIGGVDLGFRIPI